MPRIDQQGHRRDLEILARQAGRNLIAEYPSHERDEIDRAFLFEKAVDDITRILRVHFDREGGVAIEEPDFRHERGVRLVLFVDVVDREREVDVLKREQSGDYGPRLDNAGADGDARALRHLWNY